MTASSDPIGAAGGARPLDVGDIVPTFRLRHTFDAEIDLGDLLERGSVVLLFYVFDFGHV